MMPEPDAPTRLQVVEALEALIVALDRRVPHVERAGEVQIAQDASALRAAAIERLHALQAPSTPADDGSSRFA